MAVWLGPDLVLVCNDRFPRGPDTIGRPAGPGRAEALTEVLRTGVATATLTPIRDRGGRPIGVLDLPTAGVDRDLFDAIEEGLDVIELILDPSGTVVDYTLLEVNAAHQRMTGFPREWIGRRLRQLVANPEPRWLEMLDRVGRTGERGRLEVPGVTSDRWFEVEAARLGGPESRRVALVFDDVTDRTRREAHQALLAAIGRDFAALSTEADITRAVGERLAAHLDITTCSVADFEDGWAVVRSAYAREGAPPAAARLRVADYLDQELQAAARAGRTVVLRDLRTDPRVDAVRYEALGVRSGVIVPLRRDGEWAHSFAVGAPEPRDWRPDEVELLEEVAGRFFPRIERARVEEALRAAQARLEEADRRKDHFLAVLSHELRNPLAPVRNSLHVLRRVPPDSEPARRSLAVIERQVDQLTHLVDDLLDVTRITHDKIRLRRAREELGAWVGEVVDDHRGLFDVRGVQVAFAAPPAPVPVDVDRGRVAQIVSNLLQNAARFTPPGGRVAVSVDQEADQAVIRVADSGPGLTPEVRAHLFEPFVQAEPSLDRAPGGLGLALVRGLVELHGGTVTADSAGPGLGATFLVRLPVATRGDSTVDASKAN
jgi:signal transduction histidine kinase